MATTRDDANTPFDAFLEKYEEHIEARGCWKQYRAVRLTVHDLAAEHWQQLRTTNPIESTFAASRSAPTNQTLRNPAGQLDDDVPASASRTDVERVRRWNGSQQKATAALIVHALRGWLLDGHGDDGTNVTESSRSSEP